MLRALHGTERIVTVTGPGGIGKTQVRACPRRRGI